MRSLRGRGKGITNDLNSPMEICKVNGPTSADNSAREANSHNGINGRGLHIIKNAFRSTLC